MRLPSSLRELRRLALLLGGEGMQSGLHFALNLALIALLPAQDYGTFAFTLVLGSVGLVYVRALTAMPASIYIGRSRRDVFVYFYEGAFKAAALALCFLMALIAAGILSVWADAGSAWCGGAVVGFWSLRSHTRTVGIACKRLGAVTLGDAVFALTGSLGSVAALRYAPDRLQGVLLSLALANVAGAATVLLARGTKPRFDFGRRARFFYSRLASRLVWSLFSNTAAVLQGQGLAFLVVGVAGPAAYAPIAAMVAFFAPLRIFSLSLANMLQPEISKLSSIGDDAGWRALRNTWTLRALVLALLYGDVGLFVIPHLHLRSVQGQPVALIAVFAWILHAIVLAYLLPRILLESRMRFRDIAMVTTIGAAVGLGATALLLWSVGPSYCIVGAVLGEAVVALATWRQAATTLLASGRRTSERRAASNETPHDGVFEAEPLA